MKGRKKVVCTLENSLIKLSVGQSQRIFRTKVLGEFTSVKTTLFFASFNFCYSISLKIPVRVRDVGIRRSPFMPFYHSNIGMYQRISV